MKKLLFVGFLLIFSVEWAFVGCGPQQVCAPGATQECVCVGKPKGAQTCAGDGSRWEPCQCPHGPNEPTPRKEPVTADAPDAQSPGEPAPTPDRTPAKERPREKPPEPKQPSEGTSDASGREPVQDTGRTDNPPRESDLDAGQTPRDTPTADAPPTERDDSCISGSRLCYTGPKATVGFGICKQGTQLCLRKRWQACKGDITPMRSDICFDRVDGNCDSKVDEGCTGANICRSKNETRVAPQAKDQTFSAIVATGSEYGLAWSNGGKLHFQRLSATGKAIGKDLALSTSKDLQVHSLATWTGSEYIVAWSEGKQNISLKYARISSSGQMVGQPVFVAFLPNAFQVSMAWNATLSTLAFVWLSKQSVVFKRFSAKGVAIGTETIVASSQNYKPHLVAAGKEYGLLWGKSAGNSHSLHFKRLSATGAAVGNELKVASYSPDAGAGLTWTGKEFAAVWTRLESSTPKNKYTPYFQRIDASSAKAGKELQVGRGATTRVEMNVAWNGTHYGVLWNTSPAFDPQVSFLVFQRISPAGTFTGPGSQVGSYSQRKEFPSLAATNLGLFAAAWIDPSNSPRQLYFAQLDCK